MRSTKRIRDSGVARSDTTWLRDSALLVSGFTALAYATAYCYELGYGGYFSVPAFLIEPTISIIVAAVLGLVFTALSMFHGVALLRMLLSPLPAGFRVKVYLTVFSSVAALAIMGFTWSALAAIAFFTFVFCGVHITALVFGRGSWQQRLMTVDSTPDRLDSYHPMSTQALGSVTPGAIGIAVLLLIFAQALGAFNARSQRDFYVIEARPDVALVRQYGDLMVGVKFNDREKQATGEVVIFKVGDEFKQVNVNARRIGPLTGKARKFLQVPFD